MSQAGITIQERVPLSQHTTFKCGGSAQYYAEAGSAEDIRAALRFAADMNLPYFILGGGSNLIVSDAGFSGIVIHISNEGTAVQSESDGPHVLVQAASGGLWDDFVKFTVEQGYWGLENLSRIPGQVGAFAVQNVGAYGVEARDSVVEVEAYDIKSDAIVRLSNAECEFRYRRSIFNTTEQGRYVILSTILRLTRAANPRIEYPDLVAWFEGNSSPSQREIRQAIMTIRDRKFPFPPESVEGNAGSFFKNVIVGEEKYQEVLRHFRKNFPDAADMLEAIRHKFPSDEGIKIPTAFLLDVCGLKGYGHGNVELNSAQPMIVLNKTGKATSSEVMALVKEVREVVREKTSLLLLTEPEFVGFSEKELKSFGFSPKS